MPISEWSHIGVISGMLLPDGKGYWLWPDGTRILWDNGEGTKVYPIGMFRSTEQDTDRRWRKVEAKLNG